MSFVSIKSLPTSFYSSISKEEKHFFLTTFFILTSNFSFDFGELK